MSTGFGFGGSFFVCLFIFVKERRLSPELLISEPKLLPAVLVEGWRCPLAACRKEGFRGVPRQLYKPHSSAPKGSVRPFQAMSL